MKRITIIVLAVVATAAAATAIASIAPRGQLASKPANISIVAKNQAFPVFGEIEVDECQVENCSDE